MATVTSSGASKKEALRKEGNINRQRCRQGKKSDKYSNACTNNPKYIQTEMETY